MHRTHLLAVLAIVIAAPLTRAQSIAPPRVPDNLRVPEGNVPFLRAAAEGTQNYVCLPRPAGLTWEFQGPQATLFLDIRWFNGTLRQQVLTHFLSPNPQETGSPARATWQSSLDTSATWAVKVAESRDPEYVSPGAIPWFLLRITGSKRGPAGGTSLTRTTFIQRINTTGGAVAGTTCSEAGTLQFVPYTAEYVFYHAIRD